MTKSNKKESDEYYNSSSQKPIIPWIVFLFSISIVLISFTSVMFPALILVSGTETIPGIDPVTPDPYEPGVWATGALIYTLLLKFAIPVYTGELRFYSKDSS